MNAKANRNRSYIAKLLIFQVILLFLSLIIYEQNMRKIWDKNHEKQVTFDVLLNVVCQVLYYEQEIALQIRNRRLFMIMLVDSFVTWRFHGMISCVSQHECHYSYLFDQDITNNNALMRWSNACETNSAIRNIRNCKFEIVVGLSKWCTKYAR